ncbi:MAG: STN domain-containing protein, partial [Comamonadaceae bacterium]|nr:STN domain-containing protein [Comamonadaceae bacterium]
MQPITPLRAQRLRPTVLAATLALLGAGPLPALAQAAALQAARGQHAYDIPAQPLGLTLTRIATESGQPVSVDAALVQGIAAPAVRGSYTAEQAVRAALAGSGLAVARTGSGALT